VTEPRFPWARWLVAATGLYVAWTVVFTWPLCRVAATHLPATQGFGWVDLHLHLWTLAWVSHALVTDPIHVFDANIFHPARLTLAGSDHLLGTLPVAGPVYWLTGNPVAAVNAVVLTSFPLAALAAFALVAAATGSGWGGLVAGLVYAFAPWRARYFVAVQTFSVQYLPLALLALGAYLRRGRPWLLVAGLVALAVQLLVAYYLSYATLVALAAALAVAAVTERPRVARRWAALGLGLMVVLGVVALVSLPYLARRDSGSIAAYGGAVGTAVLSDWVAGGLVRRAELVYLGLVPLGLAILACVPGARRLRQARALFLAIGLAGWVLCLGSHLRLGDLRLPLPYAWLAAVVPGFASMRSAMRFFTLVLLGLSGLAGIGIARLHARLGAGRLTGATGALLAALVLVEYRPLDWPLAVQPLATGAAVPPAYRWLAEHGEGGPLVELPVGPEGTLTTSFREGRAMYFSTYHWLPLVGGYTAYPPPSHRVLMRLVRRLPEPESLEALVNLAGVRWVLVHLDALAPAQRAAWEAPPGLAPAARFGEDVVYAVTRERSADWQTAMLAPEPGRTASGVSLTRLPDGARAARLEALDRVTTIPPHAEPRVRVTNLGPLVWPGLGATEAGLVALQVAWEPLDVEAAPGRPQTLALARDLAPGASMEVSLSLRPPGPGRWRVTVRLVQTPDDAFPVTAAPPLTWEVEVRVPHAA
jgi:hypothetical protein